MHNNTILIGLLLRSTQLSLSPHLKLRHFLKCLQPIITIICKKKQFHIFTLRFLPFFCVFLRTFYETGCSVGLDPVVRDAQTAEVAKLFRPGIEQWYKTAYIKIKDHELF